MCIFTCVSVLGVFGVMQSRSEFTFDLWQKSEKPSCAQDVSGLEFSGHFSPVQAPLVRSFSLSAVLIYLTVSSPISFSHLTLSTVSFRVALDPSWMLFPQSTAADTCWASPQKQKLKLSWAQSLSAVAPWRWQTGNQFNPANTTFSLPKMSADQDAPVLGLW